MRVRPKHGERSGSDCRVSKQNFRDIEKLTHCQSDGKKLTDRESRRGWSINHGRYERYKKQHIVFVEEYFYAISIFSIQKAEYHLVVFHPSV